MTRPLVIVLMREIPELTSLLYDLDRLPEQVASGSKEEWEMFCLAAHLDKLRIRLTPISSIAGLGPTVEGPMR